MLAWQSRRELPGSLYFGWSSHRNTLMHIPSHSNDIRYKMTDRTRLSFVNSWSWLPSKRDRRCLRSSIPRLPPRTQYGASVPCEAHSNPGRGKGALLTTDRCTTRCDCCSYGSERKDRVKKDHRCGQYDAEVGIAAVDAPSRWRCDSEDMRVRDSQRSRSESSDYPKYSTSRVEYIEVTLHWKHNSKFVSRGNLPRRVNVYVLGGRKHPKHEAGADII